MCLAWVLLFGEPRVTTDCKSLDAFWKHRRRAKAETRDGECVEDSNCSCYFFSNGFERIVKVSGKHAFLTDNLNSLVDPLMLSGPEFSIVKRAEGGLKICWV
jgi:hypothetical protein